nr:DNA replication and repair protein RecF [Deinobacterium chartae]
MLRSLSTLHYRNLEDGQLRFPPGLTSIVGQNGQGKTNLQEAVYLVLTGLSEVSRLEQLVRHGESEAFVRAELDQGGVRSVLEVGLGRGRRITKVDGVRVRAGELPRGSAVWIRPEDSALVLGSPGTRRAFLDALLSRLSARYAQVLNLYERNLAQRNAALRSGETWAMDVWNLKLAELGSEILNLRRRMQVRLEELARAAHARLGGGEDLRLSLSETTSPERFLGDLEARRAEELARGQTLVGPHRDDLRIELRGHPAGDFASRGEARTIALALRQAEFDLLSERYGEPPLLLIDDFTAELDPSRRAYLLELAQATPQAIVTGTEEAPGAALLLEAQAGRLGVRT